MASEDAARATLNYMLSARRTNARPDDYKNKRMSFVSFKMPTDIIFRVPLNLFSPRMRNNKRQMKKGDKDCVILNKILLAQQRDTNIIS